MTTKDAQLNKFPYEDGCYEPPLYTFLIRFIRATTNSVRADEPPEKTKEKVIGWARGEFENCRRPPMTESAINKIVERYLLWDTRIYTAPEEREWATYWLEVRQYIRKLGISLKDFDKAADVFSPCEISTYQKLLIGFYLIAEDRCPSFIINGCYQEIASKALSVVYQAIHPTPPMQFGESIQNLRDHPDDIKMKLLELMFLDNGDTVGQASTIIQTMLYIDENPDLLTPYLLALEGKEITAMVQKIIDSLLVKIFGEDKIHAKSEYF